MPFRDIAGHRHLFELLAGAAERRTLPPSLIFTGPDGVGKRMAAVALAQFVNCLQPADGDGCGTCASCTRIARMIHSDVLVLEPGDDLAATTTKLRDAAKAKKVTVLEPSAAADGDVLAMTKAKAEELGIKKISDLKGKESSLVMGGPPECAQRVTCYKGLQDVYGLKFKEFKPLDTGGPITGREITHLGRSPPCTESDRVEPKAAGNPRPAGPAGRQATRRRRRTPRPPSGSCPSSRH